MAGKDREGLKEDDRIETVHDCEESNLEAGRNIRAATMTRVLKNQRGWEAGGGNFVEVGPAREGYYFTKFRDSLVRGRKTGALKKADHEPCTLDQRSARLCSG